MREAGEGQEWGSKKRGAKEKERRREIVSERVRKGRELKKGVIISIEGVTIEKGKAG